jgi:hypothetical protein
MGLTAFKGKKPTKSEITVAKNYLKEEELAILNRLVSAYLDIAEVNAMQHKAMTMKDWIGILDGFMRMSQQTILEDAGKISADLAQRKALTEYEHYKNKASDELSEVERQFLTSIEVAEKYVKKQQKK